MTDTNEWKGLGTLSLINYTEKHAERLERSGEPGLVAWSKTVRGSVADAKNAYAASRPLRALWTAATARKDLADDDLDSAVSGLSYDLLGPKFCRGDRSAADYRALFPEGNINFINGPDRAELARVQMMIEVLESNSNHPMASRAAELKAKSETMTAALSEMSAAQGAYEAARRVEKEKRDALHKTLRKSIHVVTAETGSRKKADAYFPTIAESRVPEEEEAAKTGE
jgi:hypothetical protein